MTRDYAKKRTTTKHRQTRKKKTAEPISMTRWLITGLLLGLFIAGLIYLKQNQKSPKRYIPTKTPSTQKAQPEPQAEVAEPRFDFYTMLSETPVDAPTTREEKTSSSQPTPAAEQTDNATYLLQIASFAKASDADQLKAELILSGNSIVVKTASVAGKKRHRVFIGPFDSRREALNKKRELRKQNQDSLLIKQTN